MITKIELRRLSLEFRRLSSNLLLSTYDNHKTPIQRFKLFIDDTPFVAKLLKDMIGTVDFNYKDCFTDREIIIPVNESYHIKSMYDYMSEIVKNGSNVWGASTHYYLGKGNFNENIRDFLNDAFKPLIDFINDSISQEMILLEETEEKSGKIEQNIYGDIYGTNSLGNENKIQNKTVIKNEALLKQLTDVIELLKSDEENKELLEEFSDDFEIIQEQMHTEAPKVSRIKKALENIKKFPNQVLTSMTATHISNEILDYDWETLINSIELFLMSLGG